MNKKGFTLIEIVLTLVICTAIFSGVLPLALKTTTSNKTARLKLYAYEAAHQELENMRGSNISSITNHSFAVTNIPGATGTIVVSNMVNGSAQTDIVSVKSRVSWTFKNKSEAVELKTYIYGG